MESRFPGYILDIMDSCAKRKVRLWAVEMIIPPATLIWMRFSCYHVGVHNL